MSIYSLILLVIIIFCVYKIFTLRKRGATNKRIIKVLNQFQDKDAFIEALNQEFNPENDAVFNARLQALRVWGGAYHDEEEMFFEGLKNLDLSQLIHPDSKQSKIGENESAFFWLLLFTPNNLYSKGKTEWMNALYEKLDLVKEELQNEMVQVVGNANRLFYEKKEDRGKATYDKILEGDYADLFYTKEMIGLYKGLITAMRAVLYLEDQDQANYEICLDSLNEFAHVPLGKRWLKEIGLAYPYEEEEKEEESIEEE